MVVTRNSYGSLCLNTPNVLFADVDVKWNGAWRMHPLGWLLIFVVGIIAGISLRSFLIGAGIAVGLAWLWIALYNSVNQKRRPAGQALAKQENLNAIRAFADKHPEWHLRVYETPAGRAISTWGEAPQDCNLCAKIWD